MIQYPAAHAARLTMIPVFTHPWALLFLLLLPPCARHWPQRSRGAWRYSDARLLPTLPSRRARWAHWGGLSLRIVGLTFAIIALSGPRWPDPQRVETEGI